MFRANPWIIVGGGASGLATAFFLRRFGLDSVIVERGSSLGGRMGTVRLGDRALDCGGKNIGRQYTLFRTFAASLGNHPLEHFGLNSSQVIDGRLETFDAAARWRTMARLTRGASVRDLVRFARLLLTVKRDELSGYLGSDAARALGRHHDERAADAYFSRAFCERILRPMTVRMNGAEPDEVYVGNLLSNVRMLTDTYEQFTNGLMPLLDAFCTRYDVRLDTRTEELLLEGGRVTGVRVRYADGSAGELRGAGVILATPANAAAALTEQVLPRLTAELRSVAYYPVTLALAEYDQPVFTPAVRAVVFGRDEVVSNAGAYGVHDLNLVRYTFSGRAFRRIAAIDRNDHALVDHAESVLARHMPFRATRRRFVAKHFDTGLCAYTAHHGRFLDRVASELRQVEGLYLTGDYIQGASIEACFRAASACAQQLAQTHEQVFAGARRRTTEPVAGSAFEVPPARHLISQCEPQIGSSLSH